MARSKHLFGAGSSPIANNKNLPHKENMSPPAASDPENTEVPVDKPRKWWLILLLLVFGAAVVAALISYTQRLVIVDRYVQEYLDDLGLDAEYEIVDLGLREQHLRNIRIGQPGQPDLMISDLVVITTPQLSGVVVDEVRLNGVKLYAEYKDDRLSFGALDQFIYTGSDEPLALPDLNISLDDARARIVTPYGVVGVSAKGSGHLLDGFEGDVAVLADGLSFDGCTINKPTAFWHVAIDSLQPKIAGPLRVDGFDCAAIGAASGIGAIQTRITVNRDLDEADFSLAGAVAKLRYALGGAQNISSANTDIAVAGSINAQTIDGEADFAFAEVGSPWANAESGQIKLKTNGELAFADLTNSEALALSYQVQADNIALQQGRRNGPTGVDAALKETPFGPLWEKAGPVFGRASSASRIAATGDLSNGIVSAEQITLREGNNRLIARAQNVRYNLDRAGLRGLESLRFTFAHPQLPKLSGDWRVRGNQAVMQFSMPEYRAGSAALAIADTRLQIPLNGAQNWGVDSIIRFSGPLPGGGRISDARIPVSGVIIDGSRYFAKGGRCQTFGFSKLSLSGLNLERQVLSLCPKQGQPLLAFGTDGLSINARTQKLALDTVFQGTPFSVSLGAADIGYPGETVIENLEARIGEDESATSLSADSITLSGSSDLAGQFSGAQAYIGQVPLLLSEGQGEWGFANSALTISSDDWTVSDRADYARFAPLQGRAISLILEDGAITARGDLYAPDSLNLIATVDVAHDLATSQGRADLSVPGIRFVPDGLQPDDLTVLTVGIIELVNGSVSGTGRINWNAEGVTSNGKFGTDGIDLAAAFGLVKGLEGQIVFNDLLALQTPPGQIVTIEEINPGIAAYNGVVRYQLLANQRVKLEEAHWPFSGGDLSLEPTTFNLAIEEERELNFEMRGLDAAVFMTQFDFDNLAATGRFDGRLPMRFNRLGGRIEAGRLAVGPEGGTLAYIGELTYEDLGAYGNFAFQSLRDIRYETLTIEMDGPLDGELVTRVQFTGLSQGEQASRNFLTKQIAKLPIQFNINIRAPFYRLITSTRSLYDTNYLLDPYTAGILPPRDEGKAADDTKDNNPE